MLRVFLGYKREKIANVGQLSVYMKRSVARFTRRDSFKAPAVSLMFYESLNKVRGLRKWWYKILQISAHCMQSINCWRGSVCPRLDRNIAQTVKGVT